MLCVWETEGRSFPPEQRGTDSAWDKMRLGKLGEAIASEAVRGTLWSMVFKMRAMGSYCKVLRRGWHNWVLALKRSFWLSVGGRSEGSR